MLIPSFRRSLKSLFKSSRSVRSRQRHRAALRSTRMYAAVERLEDRLLLTGDPGWAFNLGSPIANSPNNDSSSEVIVAPNGDVVIVGAFQGTVDFDPGPGTAERIQIQGGGYIARYTTNEQQQPQFIWATTFGTLVNQVEFGPNGNIYIASTFDSSRQFGSETLTSNGGKDIFVAKLDADGNFLWAKSAGGTGEERFGDLDVASDCTIYVGGGFRETVDFNPDPGEVFNLDSPGAEDGFLWQLDTSGGFVNAVGFGGPSGGALLQRLAVDNIDGSIVAVGAFDGNADFGGTPLTSLGQRDTFVVKLNALDIAGSPLWVEQVGGTGHVAHVRMDMDASGNIYRIFQDRIALTHCNQAGYIFFIDLVYTRIY